MSSNQASSLVNENTELTSTASKNSGESNQIQQKSESKK